MLPYFIIIIFYVASFSAFYMLTASLTYSLVFKFLGTSFLLFLYRKYFKFRIRLDLFSIVVGIVIFLVWIGVDGFYPKLLAFPGYIYTLPDIFLKLLFGVAIAPVIEEFFTRFFLIRWLVNSNWKDIPLGKYTPLSFIVTVLFFGFSHSHWFAGLITGMILNFLLYKHKTIESCIVAHAVANLALGVFVVYTGGWHFW